jgi:hypothetical protein
MIAFLSNDDFKEFGHNLRRLFPFIVENIYSEEEKYKLIRAAAKAV